MFQANMLAVSFPCRLLDEVVFLWRLSLSRVSTGLHSELKPKLKLKINRETSYEVPQSGLGVSVDSPCLCTGVVEVIRRRKQAQTCQRLDGKMITQQEFVANIEAQSIG